MSSRAAVWSIHLPGFWPFTWHFRMPLTVVVPLVTGFELGVLGPPADAVRWTPNIARHARSLKQSSHNFM
jgi:hypothetical protein